MIEPCRRSLVQALQFRKVQAMFSIRIQTVVFGATLCCCLSLAPATFAGVIANGDFETPDVAPDPFSDWMTASGMNVPEDPGGIARFLAGDDVDGLMQLFQMFNPTPGSTQLMFEYRLMQADGVAGGGNFADSFTAFLFDPSFDPVRPVDPGLSGFFKVEPTSTGDGFKETTPNGGVTTNSLGNGWRKVSLSLPPISTGQYTIGFLMRSDADQRITTVDVDNVMVSPGVAAIPEPASLVIWGLLGLGALPVIRRRRRKVEDSCGWIGKMM